MNDLSWGHGLYIRKLVYSLITVVLILAVIIWALELRWSLDGRQPAETLTFMEAVYVTVSRLFSGSSGAAPSGIWSRLVALIGSFFGLVFFGLFVAALYRKISR